MLVPLQLVGVAFTPPPNVTVLVPCVAPKFAPAIVTAVPATPEPGLRLVILGAGLVVVTVKLDPLLARPPTVTTTLPVTAPAGTGAITLVPLQLVGVALTAPNMTVLVPCAAPKFAPAIVTAVPTTPEPGLKLVILGAGLVVVTVKLAPLLARPLTVTTTLPVTAPAGTGAITLVPLQLVGVALTAPNMTVLVPCVAPKFAPVIVSRVPTTPELGLKLVILGAGLVVVTVKLAPLLAWPPTVTTTLPVTAPTGTDTTMVVQFQLVGVAFTPPPNMTVLVPCVAPKFAPVIVSRVPTVPELKLKLLMLGVTVKVAALLA
jgi:uncharacterized protein YjeT (DUF2065 family)